VNIHPARSMTFKELTEGLAEAKAARIVSEQADDTGLRLYCYTKSAVYDRNWTPFSLMARGLILDVNAGKVVATPFPKFFNLGERGNESIPDLPFETFEKVDGSLIIIFWHGGRWRTATKGSLRSEQAVWAQTALANADLTQLDPGTTYLAEAVYPQNRIVIRYEETGLVLLAAYREDGSELAYDDLMEVGARLGWRVATRHAYSSVSDLIAHTSTLPATEEGFVIRFADGQRLKVKGEEYRRIHALISRCTPLAMWDAMLAGDDMANIRRDLPEEFWTDFDAITGILHQQLTGLISRVQDEARAVAHLSDKDVGLRLAEFPEPVRGLIFPYRKNGGDLLSGRTRQALFKTIRPNGNELEGYVPSYAMTRVADEAA
jgi:RNA ligase